MLRNAARHLTDRGRLIIQEWMIEDDGTGPELSAQFNLHLLINLDGDLYREAELRNMLQQTGFSHLKTIQTGGIYDVMLAEKTPRENASPKARAITRFAHR